MKRVLEEDLIYEILSVVEEIPKGSVATYGQIATIIGNPRMARQVGYALYFTPPNIKIPWWRVISSKGYLSIRHPEAPKELQKQLLLKEKVEVNDKFVVDLKKYQWGI